LALPQREDQSVPQVADLPSKPDRAQRRARRMTLRTIGQFTAWARHLGSLSENRKRSVARNQLARKLASTAPTTKAEARRMCHEAARSHPIRRLS